jgi:hypothetical protein
VHARNDSLTRERLRLDRLMASGRIAHEQQRQMANHFAVEVGRAVIHLSKGMRTLSTIGVRRSVVGDVLGRSPEVHPEPGIACSQI